MSGPEPIFDPDDTEPGPGDTVWPSYEETCPQCGHPINVTPGLRVLGQYDSNGQYVSEVDYLLCVNCSGHLWLEPVTAYQLMSLSAKVNDPIREPSLEVVQYKSRRLAVILARLLAWLVKK